MFEAAEVGETLDAKTYKAELPAVREALLDAQFRLRHGDFSVIVVVAGTEGAGKGETVNSLLEWLDARDVETHALSAPSDEERERPPFYRFWRQLPASGKLGIFFGSWYTAPIVQRIDDEIDEDKFDREMQRIVDFERMLANEGVLLVKLWLHITKQQQRKRLKRLEKNPETAWRVSKQDWRNSKTYDAFIRTAASAIRQTSSGDAPWHIVEAIDSRYRNMNVAKYLLSRMQRRLDTPKPPAPVAEPLPIPNARNVINTLKLDQPYSRDLYQSELQKWQGRLSQQARLMTARRLSAVLVFEGSDGAGKGGCIRRLVRELDARFYQVIPIAAPTDEERAHPYLWRFWRLLPRDGHICVFDRSWYGRVLVERVEGYSQNSDWQRAYSEINAFEEELDENRTLVIKFWLAISSEEQLARFKHREETGYKRYKLTDEDWRNREKAAAYEAAACDMVSQTSTAYAPWTLVEADNKLFARIKVLRTVCERLEKAFDMPVAKPKKRHKK